MFLLSGTVFVASPTEYPEMRPDEDREILILRIERTAVDRRIGDALGFQPPEPTVFSPYIPRCTDVRSSGSRNARPNSTRGAIEKLSKYP